jgi:hypothetical protein
LDFITCNDEVNKHAVKKEKINTVDKRERDKNQICKWWKKGRKKYVITIGLFTR